QLSCLPLNGGTRIRQQFDHMSCTLDGATICYASSLYGEAQLDIPGTVESDLSLPLGMPAPPPPDDNPPPPEVHGDLAARLAAIADGVAALRLALSQQPLQSAIVAELRRGVLDRPAAAIADDVASFGIGAGQAQAPAWRQLIAEIRQLA